MTIPDKQTPQRRARRVRRHPVAWIAGGVVVALALAGCSALGAGEQPSASTNSVSGSGPTGQKTPGSADPGQGDGADGGASTDASTQASTGPADSPVATRPTATKTVVPAAVHTCSVASYAKDARLGTLEAQVRSVKTGAVLFDRRGTTPAPTASVLKTVNAAAVLSSLGANTRITTKVVAGKTKGTVVIVGGGDPSLASRSGTWFSGGPTLTQLAAQVKKAWAANPKTKGTKITRIVADASLFSGPTWLRPGWDEHEERVVEGSTSYITALMVDGDKRDPSQLQSPRGTDPVGDAGRAFAKALGVPSATVSKGKAPVGTKVLGAVKSKPIRSLLNEALLNSDNTVMELLTRLVAIKEGTGNTFAAENAGVHKALARYGLPTSGIKIVDGSGLSDANRVPPSFLTQYMIKVFKRADGLGLVYDSLPVAGRTGTLSAGDGRFTGSFNSVAAGHVNAKTGWIDNGYTLSGVIHAKDGTPLTFAIFALGNVGDNAKVAIDNLTAAIYLCGAKLSNG